MTDIFVSYSRVDQEIAQAITERLRELKFDVWLDLFSIPAGVRWDQAIEQALVSAKTMIVLLSPEATNSQNVIDEINYFMDLQKVIIPVLVRTADIPFRLRRLQYVDARTEAKIPEAIDKIAKILLGILPERVTVEEARQQRRELEVSDSIEVAPLSNRPGAATILAEARKLHKSGVYNRAIAAYTQVLFDEEHPEYRIQAVEALGELLAASSDLVNRLHTDPSSKVRLAITKVLAKFQSPLVANALQIASILDSDMNVRVHAAVLNLLFREPHQVSTWLDTLVSSGNTELRTVVSEAVLFANELSDATGHVFVSYSRRDAEAFTLELVDTLRGVYKFKVWIDTNLTPGSESWKKGIAKAIEQCSLLLLILSPEVHNSKYIGEEVSYAEQLGKSRLFVKYKPTHMPFGMSEMQGLRDNLAFEDYPEEMLKALVEELERRKLPKSV